MSLPLLVVDDDRVTRDLLKEIFERENYVVTLAKSGEEAVACLRTQGFPVVVSDVRMLDVDGFAVLESAKRADPSCVVILMTGFGTMEGAVAAIQRGAFDYLSKPFRMEELKALVDRGRRHWEATRGAAPAEERTAGGAEKPKALIGKSPRIVEVYKTLARATLSPSNVLIIGESGTGKELVARAIHEHSPRRTKPFVAVNCGALTETLLESELFGHVRGAFTGAVNEKHGLFEEADGGTLFLDEIGDVSPGLQVKLLRAIQEGEFKPVGSAESRRSDARIVAATHRDLEASVAQGTFREDLYYRLKVIRIDLPPLRERIDDLPELATSFVARYSAKMGKKVSHIADDALQCLSAYAWPGNVRELENAIERAITMTRTSILYPEDFPREIMQAGAEKKSEGPAGSLEDAERAHIIMALEESGGNLSRTAARLGIDRKTLARKIRRFGIEREKKP